MAFSRLIATTALSLSLCLAAGSTHAAKPVIDVKGLKAAKDQISALKEQIKTLKDQLDVVKDVRAGIDDTLKALVRSPRSQSHPSTLETSPARSCPTTPVWFLTLKV